MNRFISSKKYVTYRVIFIPDKKLSKRSVELASEISLLGEHYFKVDDKKFYTHLTAYKAGFPKENEEKVFEVIEDFAKLQAPIKLYYKGFFAEWGWLGLDFKRNKAIYGVHKDIVSKLNTLRKGHIRLKYLEKFKMPGKYPGRQKEYIRKYGYPQVMTEYHPHLSLLRFTGKELAIKVRNLYNVKKVSIENGRIEDVAIVQGGEHGTVTNFIQKYRLEGNLNISM